MSFKKKKRESKMLLMLQLVFIETVLSAFQMDTAPICVKKMYSDFEHVLASSM